MATEEVDVAPATQEAAKAGGIGKTIGLAAGLFFLVVALAAILVLRVLRRPCGRGLPA